MIDQQRRVLEQHLRRNIAGEVRFDTVSRKIYSTDASIYMIEPLGVVIPRSVEDIVAVIQMAQEMEVPVTARGGGTSLSGQSIGPGIVVDCSKYLNQIVELDPVEKSAVVQPGVILDQLNRAAAKHDLQFGPDVATASRANLAGMIGNNSAGARSIVHGKTIDHVHQMSVVLSDGSRATWGSLTPEEWEAKSTGKTLEANIHRRVREIVVRDADEIARRFPRVLRRVSGYNLDVICQGLTGTVCGYQRSSVDRGPWTVDREEGAVASSRSTVHGPRSADSERSTTVGLHQLLVGSEGTLAFMTEARVGLVPRPKHRGLIVPHFASLSAAMDALAACLEFGPSAVEMLDHLILRLTAENLALRDTMKFISGRPQAVLMVEFSGNDPAEIADRVEKLKKRLEGGPGVTAVVPAIDPVPRDALWDLRRAGMPLLYGIKGDRKPITFVEDPAVAPEHLPEFIARFRELLKRHDTDGSFYGHASVGCVHIRPLINLKDPEDVRRMRAIASEVTDLVIEYGGSLSGEHGDGLVRSEFNERLFGPRIYRAFCEVKQAFDPRNLFNPGKIVHAPPMTENLRYPPDYHPLEPPTLMDYSNQEGFVRAVEMCNGSGVCRKLQGGVMCPSFRATRDENDSTRARANILRLALSSEEPLQSLQSDEVYQVHDLCLMCKACKAECPSNVDVAKLKTEFLQFYYSSRRRPLGHVLMANLPALNRLGAPFAPLVNWFQSRGISRWLLEKLAGIDRRRSLPRLYRNHFRKWFANRQTPVGHASRLPGASETLALRKEVLLLADCFTTYNEPAIGQSTVRVLERAGYSVELADIECCGRILLSKGYLREAKALVQRQVPRLLRTLADGMPILGLEPSCLLTLIDEWPALMPGEATRRIAAAAHLADAWLAQQVQSGECSLPLREDTSPCVVHGHCHQKALVGMKGTAAALRMIPGLDVKVLDTGCCGMAGSFGFEREHYDLSVKVAELSLLPALEQAPEGAIVVAPGTSCRHQIHDLAHKRALHPMEVLAERMAEPENPK